MDAPIRRIIGSVHVPLQSLVKGGQKVDVTCGLGALHTKSEMEPAETLYKASLVSHSQHSAEIVGLLFDQFH